MWGIKGATDIAIRFPLRDKVTVTVTRFATPEETEDVAKVLEEYHIVTPIDEMIKSEKPRSEGK
jgi:hypothetical protein